MMMMMLKQVSGDHSVTHSIAALYMQLDQHSTLAGPMKLAWCNEETCNRGCIRVFAIDLKRMCVDPRAHDNGSACLSLSFHSDC